MKRKSKDVDELAVRKKARQEDAAAGLSGDSPALEKVRLLSSLCKSELVASQEMVDVALQLVKSSDDRRLRMWAFKFLVTTSSRLQAKELSDLVRQCCCDPRACVREAAVNAAVHLKYTDDADVVLRLLRDDSPSIRLAAMNLIALQAKNCEHLGADYAYLQLCSVLSGMSRPAKEQACLVLGTMECISENVVLHTLNKRSQLAPEAVVANGKHLPGAELKLLLEMGAGAFIQALEDEYYQVRIAAIQALVKLAASKSVLEVVCDLFFDLTNDQSFIVREMVIQALCEVVRSVTLRDKHVNMSLRFLEDSSQEVRRAGCKLLSSMVLPSVTKVGMALQMLLYCLENHEEDKQDVLSALHSLGEKHNRHAELLMDKLISEMTGEDFDKSRLEPLLTFCSGAQVANKNIASLLPEMFMRRLTCLAPVSEHTSNLASSASTVQHIVKRGLSVNSLPRPEDKLKVLCNCRAELKTLDGGPPASLALLYIEFLSLLIRVTNGEKFRDQLNTKLGLVLGEMKQRFSGLSPDGMAQLLEMDAFFAIVGCSDYSSCLSRLSSIVTDWCRMVASGSVSDPGSFPLLKEAEQQLGGAGVHVNLGTLSQAFWPSHSIVGEGNRETWVELNVPKSNSEHPLHFIAGLPLEVKVTGVVRCVKALARQRLWVQMDFKGFSRQYRFLDLKHKESASSGKDVNFAEELEFYNMPAAALGVLRVSVLLELACGTGKEQVHCRGPTASHCVEVSSEQLLYLSRAG